MTHMEWPSSMAIACRTRLSSRVTTMPASDHDHGMVLARKSRSPMKQLSVRGNRVATMRQFFEGSHCSMSASPGEISNKIY